MEPKDGQSPFNRRIHIVWNPNQSSNPFEDPEVIKNLQKMMDDLYNMISDDDLIGDFNGALQAELDHLEDVDNMVVGDNHPVALALIMNSYKNSKG